MSILSSRKSVSSILKTPGARASISKQKKINFRLPKDIDVILKNVAENRYRQQYEELVITIRDSVIKDEDLVELLIDAKKCIHVITRIHKNFIESVLQIDWHNRSPEIVQLFKEFITHLMITSQEFYAKFITEQFLTQVKTGYQKESSIQCLETEKKRMSYMHDIFKACLKIPSYSNKFFQILSDLYPYYSSSIYENESYLFTCIQIMGYTPLLYKKILFIIIHSLNLMDINVPVDEIFDDEEMEVDEVNGMIFCMNDMEESAKTSLKLRQDAVHTLDICMDQLFAYIHRTCHVNGKLDLDVTKNLFRDLLHPFENIILMTHKTRHIQFIMFYICSLHPSILQEFIEWLWRKVSDPSTYPTIRQTVIHYIASLLARAKFAKLSLLQKVIQAITEYVHKYIMSEDSNSNPKLHMVFYSMCQALFYLIAFKQKELTDGKKNLKILQELCLSKIVSCKLNPLKYCYEAVTQNFDVMARNYQLAYCQTIIQRNKRNHLPLIDNEEYLEINKSLMDVFFPFDPYLLTQSGKWVQDIYCVSSIAASENAVEEPNERDEDDFMEESFIQETKSNREKFFYSTSPGFHT